MGGSDFLDVAFDAWENARPDEAVERVEVPQGTDYVFGLELLDKLNPAEGTMFVAFDERFGNFKRMELMQAALARGFKLEPFISPTAAVAEKTIIGPNVFIGAGVCIGTRSRIDYNTIVHAGTTLGSEVHLRASCWVEMGVTIGDRAIIGACSTLRMGAIVAQDVEVGRSCELGWPQRYGVNLPARTVFDPRYDNPILVYGS